MEVIGREAAMDDCAVIPCRDQFLVASTDMLHTATDFPGGMSDWQIGWMSVAVTLSDIAAMGADPGDILLAVGLDRPLRLRAILEGARACCSTFGARFSGGDLDHHQELTLVSSGIGFASRPVRRTGSQPGDLVGITGIPGRAQAALCGYRQHEKALFEPWPQVREGKALAGAGVTSMMDVSDGLLISLHDMLEANSGGYAIETRYLPLPEGVSREEALGYALEGGGDFGLLFTLPPGAHPVGGVEYYIIGRVIAGHEVMVDGERKEMAGYQHQW